MSKKSGAILSIVGSVGALALTLNSWQCLGWLTAAAIGINLVVAISAAAIQILEERRVP
jgi:hypothetical protein